MRLDTTQARLRLLAHDHGVFCTLHHERGIDAVPCIYGSGAVDTGTDEVWVGVPVDTVKPKAAGLLQRERNLHADPRATLLVEHWDREDWSRLWWVRAGLRWEPEAPPGVEAGLAELLARTVPQYEHKPFDRVMALRLVAVTGWAASSPEGVRAS